MKTIKNAIFLSSERNLKQFKGYGLPEIVLVGRSNVGKSSLINMLTANSKLAKVSSEQGKTRMVNFFKINEEFVLVDLPGYGFAKASHAEQESWKHMIDDYFESSQNLRMVILLVDIRHEPTDQDVQMLEYLTYKNLPVSIVATKFDKIKKSEQTKKLNDIAGKLKVGVDNVYVSSSETGLGKQKIIERIYQFIGE